MDISLFSARGVLVLAHHDEAVGVLAGGHPGLRAVDVDLAIGVLGGGGGHPLVGGAGLGLGDGQAVRRVAVLLVVVDGVLDLLRECRTRPCRT